MWDFHTIGKGCRADNGILWGERGVEGLFTFLRQESQYCERSCLEGVCAEVVLVHEAVEGASGYHGLGGGLCYIPLEVCQKFSKVFLFKRGQFLPTEAKE